MVLHLTVPLLQQKAVDGCHGKLLPCNNLKLSRCRGWEWRIEEDELLIFSAVVRSFIESDDVEQPHVSLTYSHIYLKFDDPFSYWHIITLIFNFLTFFFPSFRFTFFLCTSTSSCAHRLWLSQTHSMSILQQISPHHSLIDRYKLPLPLLTALWMLFYVYHTHWCFHTNVNPNG